MGDKQIMGDKQNREGWAPLHHENIHYEFKCDGFAYVGTYNEKLDGFHTDKGFCPAESCSDVWFYF